ncbi:MAG TPA: hypothetical protein VLB74_01585, partial [Flavobacterium sp.]|uniref:hypothetical protein n=1 Tax=Flavobacterium sp. TaxID=239 RepID=UPI002CFE3B3E
MQRIAGTGIAKKPKPLLRQFAIARVAPNSKLFCYREIREIPKKYPVICPQLVVECSTFYESRVAKASLGL